MLAARFREAALILQKLNDHGFEAYIVGGAVRDEILEKPIEDVDIASSARPEQVRRLFAKTIPVGVEHGTVVVRHNHRSYEVTTFREEEDYEDHRRPSSVTFVSSLHEDLKRRDFTMNAMAMSAAGEMIDPFGGREDLKACLIRTVGLAKDRFQEDPLRMMRAVRFAGQLSFEIEDKTEQALRQSAEDLRYISVERVTGEFEKLLMGQNTKKGFSVLASSGLYAYLPGMRGCEQQLRRLADVEFSPLRELRERWAAVSEILNIESVSSWLRKWKLSNHKVNEVMAILDTLRQLEGENWTPFLVYESGIKMAKSAERVRAILEKVQADVRFIQQIYDALPIKNRGELSVNGNDLMAWFQKGPGPWISEQVEAVEKAVIDGKVRNDKEEIRTWLGRQTY